MTRLRSYSQLVAVMETWKSMVSDTQTGDPPYQTSGP